MNFVGRYTVNAGELGPLGKLGPHNIHLNEIEVFLALARTINSFKNPYIMDFGKLLIILAILARKTEFH